LRFLRGGVRDDGLQCTFLRGGAVRHSWASDSRLRAWCVSVSMCVWYVCIWCVCMRVCV
jgi:hypothetical protein